MEYQRQHSTPYREFRRAVLDGIEPPITVRAQLEANGVNTDDLETRLRQSTEYRH